MYVTIYKYTHITWDKKNVYFSWVIKTANGSKKIMLKNIKNQKSFRGSHLQSYRGGQEMESQKIKEK